MGGHKYIRVHSGTFSHKYLLYKARIPLFPLMLILICLLLATYWEDQLNIAKRTPSLKIYLKYIEVKLKGIKRSFPVSETVRTCAFKDLKNESVKSFYNLLLFNHLYQKMEIRELRIVANYFSENSNEFHAPLFEIIQKYINASVELNKGLIKEASELVEAFPSDYLFHQFDFSKYELKTMKMAKQLNKESRTAPKLQYLLDLNVLVIRFYRKSLNLQAKSHISPGMRNIYLRLRKVIDLRNIRQLIELLATIGKLESVKIGPILKFIKYGSVDYLNIDSNSDLYTQAKNEMIHLKELAENSSKPKIVQLCNDILVTLYNILGANNKN
eukprot:NODE_368_length_8682_cov_0.309915.p2 type:complete len:328 gc:universal NODE_368_length_8682_cov_0.309915:6953-5970(-)